GPDLIFLNPNDDKNANINVIMEIDLSISIPNPTQAATKLGTAIFIDPKTLVELSTAEQVKPRFKGLGDYDSTVFASNTYPLYPNQ
ncbi:403_t:CDS:2, partial [Paraglomus occultum]